MSTTPPRPRIAFVHTVAFLVDMFRQMMDRELPYVEVVHVLNETLLKDLLRDGPSPKITARIVRQAILAADGDVDMLVFTCSSTSPAINIARPMLAIPIVKIDDPMAEQAVASGKRIGLVCTARSTVDPSSALLQDHADIIKKPIEIDVSLSTHAYDALFAGDRGKHDKIIIEEASKLAETCDAIVLAQASLAHLQEPIADKTGKPTLASPPLLIERLRAMTAVIA
jgi:Asp/Glu/hydantoin racemase